MENDSEENDSEMSEDYLVMTSKRDKIKVFFKLYWRTIIIIGAALGYFPLIFIGTNSAYPSLYVFVLATTYWIFDVLPPAVVGLIPVSVSTLFGYYLKGYIDELHVHNSVLNTLGVMMMIVAIEYSQVHKRLALKLLLIFGCSHYRLSFLLFFTSMVLAMWVTHIMACGLMIPIVKAILYELEKMGILEVYHNINKGRLQKYTRHEQSQRRPTDYTIFYFLGITYSSSIGSLATMIGSQTNEIFRYYSETIFPYAPKLVFPHHMLLNIPGVLLMETLLYLWMNFYFMGMFRAQSQIALEIGMTEEEAEYIQTLLSTQYQQLGKITFHESVVAILIVLTILLHATRTGNNNHILVSSPIIFCATLLFIIPVNLDFIKFFKKRTDTSPYPTEPSRACLNWPLMRENIHWSVLLIAAGSCMTFETLKTSGLTDELDKILLPMKNWPAPILVLVVILMMKILTEFANNACVLYSLLPNIIRLSLAARVNPHYLMSAATLSCAVPFHMVTGSPANALIVEYVHMHPWKMMQAGLGPSVIAVCVIWVTVTLWARTIWPDISVYPTWAEDHVDFRQSRRILEFDLPWYYNQRQ